MIFEVAGVYGVSLSSFNAEQRKWVGKSDIMVKNSSNKKKLSFAGMDVGASKHSEQVLEADKFFKGTESLPERRPAPNTKLHPIDKENRVILG